MGLYMASMSINQAIPFLLLPILTMYLAPKDYGYIINFSAILLIFNSIIGGGLSVNIMKNYYIKDEYYMKKLIGNLYFILLCSTVIVFIAAIFLSYILDIKLIPEKIFIFIPCISFFFMSFEFHRTTLRIKKKALSYALVTLSEVILNISLSLIMVIGLYFQWRGRVYGMAISYIVFGLISLGYFIKNDYIKFSICKKVLISILKVALPLLPSVAGLMIMRRSGIFFIDSFNGKSEAGLYGVGLNVSMIILLVSMAFINAWIPYVYEKLPKEKKKDKILLRNSIFIFTIIIFSVCTVVTFCSGLILRIMTTDAYYGARIYIPWLVFGFAFWAIRAMHMPFFIHYGKQKYIAVIAIISASLNIVLNYYAAKEIGAIGVAVSFFISNFIAYLLVFFSVRTFCNLPIVPDYRSIYLIIKHLKK